MTPNIRTTRFCIYPQGQQVILPQVLSLIAFGASFFELISRAIWPFACGQSEEWDYYRGDCIHLTMVYNWQYENNRVDQAAVQGAASFGVIALVLSVIPIAYLLSASCFELSRKMKWILLGSFLGITFLDGLTFLAMITQICDGQDCYDPKWKMERGAIATVFAVGFWFLTALSIAFLKVEGETINNEVEETNDSENVEAPTTPLIVKQDKTFPCAHLKDDEGPVTMPESVPRMSSLRHRCMS